MHMLKKINFYILLVSIFVFIVSMKTFADESDGTAVNWLKVEGAYGYILEIKDSKNELVHKETTEKNHTVIFLGKGNYKARVSVLNKFYKPQIGSRWFDLKITKSVKPLFGSISRTIFKYDEGKTPVNIYGKRFSDECTLIIKRGETLIKPEGFTRQSSNILSFYII